MKHKPMFFNNFNNLCICCTVDVVSVSDSQSTAPGFKSHTEHYLDLFHSSPELRSSDTLVNSQLVCLWPVGILNNAMFNFNHLFHLFAGPH